MVYVGMTHPEKAMETASYNRYSRYLHWLMAFLIVFIVILAGATTTTTRSGCRGSAFINPSAC